jgi:hypothetical protein
MLDKITNVLRPLVGEIDFAEIIRQLDEPTE